MPKPPPDWTVGDRIRKAREAEDMSQRELATRVGVTVDTIVQWEKDRRAIQSMNWAKLATALDVPDVWLRTGRL